MVLLSTSWFQQRCDIICVFIRKNLLPFITCLLLLAACNSITFLYQQLDWLIPWYLDDYITLSSRQQQDFEKHLSQLLVWHRKTQLTDYAAWLGELNDDIEQGLTATNLDAHEQKLRVFLRQLTLRSIPEIAALLSSLSAKQVDELFTGIEERNNKFKSEYFDLDTKQRTQKRVERVQKQLNRWLRQLTPAQLKLLQNWSENYESDPKSTLKYRKYWQSQLRKALNNRQDKAVFSAQLEPLFVDPEALQEDSFRQRRQRNLARFKNLLLDILNTMSDSQKRYLQAKLDDIAKDFTRLAAG